MVSRTMNLKIHPPSYRHSQNVPTLPTALRAEISIWFFSSWNPFSYPDIISLSSKTYNYRVCLGTEFIRWSDISELGWLNVDICNLSLDLVKNKEAIARSDWFARGTN